MPKFLHRLFDTRFVVLESPLPSDPTADCIPQRNCKARVLSLRENPISKDRQTGLDYPSPLGPRTPPPKLQTQVSQLPRPLPRPPIHLPPIRAKVPSNRTSIDKRMRTNLEPVMEGDGRLMRDIRSPPPGDVTRLPRKSSRPELAKQKSQYFEEAFCSREANGNGLVEGARYSSMIHADVRTNKFVASPNSFIENLANHLSVRYSQPASTIIITLQQGATLFFGGSFDPAYTVVVSALPSQLQPATNRRNTALLQAQLEDTLDIPMTRGYIRFVPVAEEFCAWNGNTAAGQREPENILDAHTPSQKKRTMRSLSLRRSPKVNSSVQSPSRARSDATPRREPPNTPPGPVINSQLDQSLRKKKSFMQSIFSRSVRGEADE